MLAASERQPHCIVKPFVQLSQTFVFLLFLSPKTADSPNHTKLSFGINDNMERLVVLSLPDFTELLEVISVCTALNGLHCSTRLWLSHGASWWHCHDSQDPDTISLKNRIGKAQTDRSRSFDKKNEEKRGNDAVTYCCISVTSMQKIYFFQVFKSLHAPQNSTLKQG